MNILENLKKIREIKRFSQEEIAEAMKRTQSSYARIERGATKIDFETIVDFSKAVEMEVIDVITYPDKYVKEGSEGAEIKAILQIELKKEKKDQVLKLVFGKNNLEILNR